MRIRPSEAVSGFVCWIAEGLTEAEVNHGLSSGYIKYEGVVMKVKTVQPWDLGNSLVTKMIQVEMTPELSNSLNEIMLQSTRR